MKENKGEIDRPAPWAPACPVTSSTTGATGSTKCSAKSGWKEQLEAKAAKLKAMLHEKAQDCLTLGGLKEAQERYRKAIEREAERMSELDVSFQREAAKDARIERLESSLQQANTEIKRLRNSHREAIVEEPPERILSEQETRTKAVSLPCNHHAEAGMTFAMGVEITAREMSRA